MSSTVLYERIFNPRNLFLFLSGTMLLCIFGALLLDFYYILLLPFAIAIALLGLVDVSKLYYLLVLVIPITIEIYLPSGLGIDIPGEILLIGITALSPFIFLIHFRRKHLSYLTHPITIALFFHLAWILIAGLLAESLTIGLKFFFAKLWYIIPFFFMTLFVFRKKLNYKQFFWTLMIPLALTIVYVLVRHARLGFSFSEVNSAVSPIYRNHVNYGLLMVAFIPYTWCFRQWYEKYSVQRLVINGLIVLMLVGIYFTYTRAAQLAVIIGIACYFVIKFRLVLITLLTGLIAVLLLGSYFVTNGKYLEFAPQYEKTITHENYDNLIEATVKLEDISTMERVNRWVAGGHMIGERPLTGFGPGNFYFNYKNYMVSSFVTYVSDNPDKSGIHNYYLMTLVEQGFIGLLVFMALLFTVLLVGSKTYHLISDPHYKALVMAALISIILIAVTVLINDLIEALKIGGMFFIGMAIIVKESIRQSQIESQL